MALDDVKEELIFYPSVSPNKIQRPSQASTFVFKCNRLSHDVAGSDVDRDVWTVYY